MFPLKIKLILIAVLAGILSFAGYTAYIYNKGGEAVEAKQATEQLKNEVTVRKSYDKIDKKTPFSADKRDAIEWLYGHGGRK